MQGGAENLGSAFFFWCKTRVNLPLPSPAFLRRPLFSVTLPPSEWTGGESPPCRLDFPPRGIDPLNALPERLSMPRYPQMCQFMHDDEVKTRGGVPRELKIETDMCTRG